MNDEQIKKAKIDLYAAEEGMKVVDYTKARKARNLTYILILELILVTIVAAYGIAKSSYLQNKIDASYLHCLNFMGKQTYETAKQICTAMLG